MKATVLRAKDRAELETKLNATDGRAEGHSQNNPAATFATSWACSSVTWE
jgi:hypothetical protein